jgi:hypothetical protein
VTIGEDTVAIPDVSKLEREIVRLLEL